MCMYSVYMDVGFAIGCENIHGDVKRQSFASANLFQKQLISGIKDANFI